MQHYFDINIAMKYGIQPAIILNNLYFWIEKNRANEKHFYDGYYWTWSNNYIVPPVLDDLYPVEEKRKARDFTIKGELSKWIRERESSPAFRLLC